MNELDRFSPDSKVWIYQADRPLEKEEKERIREMGERFAADWSAHGTSLKALFRIQYDRFLIFFVDEGQQEATGCSIDRSVHFIKGLESSFDLELMDRKLVAYRTDEGIRTIPFDQLERALKDGEITPDTPVFNNLVRTKKEFETDWEIPLKDSWHARLLKDEDLMVGSG
jgi:hypothetical protein